MWNWIIKGYEVYWGIYCWEIYEFISALFDLGYSYNLWFWNFVWLMS